MAVVNGDRPVSWLFIITDYSAPRDRGRIVTLTSSGVGSAFASSGILVSRMGLAFTNDAGTVLALVNQVPEPSTIILATEGLTGLRLIQWRLALFSASVA